MTSPFGPKPREARERVPDEDHCPHCGGEKRPRGIRLGGGGTRVVLACPDCCARCGGRLTYDDRGPWCTRCD